MEVRSIAPALVCLMLLKLLYLQTTRHSSKIRFQTSECKEAWCHQLARAVYLAKYAIDLFGLHSDCVGFVSQYNSSPTLYAW